MMPYYVGIDGGGTKTAVELRTRGSAAHSRAAVSYTHLTLPTNSLV